MNTGGTSHPKGNLHSKKISRRIKAPLLWKLRNIFRYPFLKGVAQVFAAKVSNALFGIITVTSELRAVAYVFQNDEDRQFYQKLSERLYEYRDEGGNIQYDNEGIAKRIVDEMERLLRLRTAVDYGVLGLRSVTNAFVAFVVDQLQTETSVFGDFKYHDSGVGTTAENVADTTIETTDGEARATGTQTESAANAYQSVGTISYTTTKAITEHGLLNDLTAGTLMDRTVFTAINVVNGDSILFTYTLTVSAGG